MEMGIINSATGASAGKPVHALGKSKAAYGAAQKPAKDIKYPQLRYKMNGLPAYYEIEQVNEFQKTAKWFTVDRFGNRSYIGQTRVGILGEIERHPMVEKSSVLFSNIWNEATGGLKNLQGGIKTHKLFGTKVIKHSLCDEGKLRFVNAEHAKAFFSKLMSEIGFVHELMPYYKDLMKNRFSHKSSDEIYVNLKDLVPDPVFGADNKGDEIVKNQTRILLGRAFHKIVTKTYAKLAKQYIPKDICFKDDINSIKDWTPDEQRNFFALCKKRLKPAKYRAIKTEARDKEVKLGVWDDMCINYFMDPLKNKSFISELPGAAQLKTTCMLWNLVINPASKMVDIRKNAVAVSPPVDDKKALMAFYKKYNKQLRYDKKTGQQALYMMFVRDLDGGRYILVKNNPETKKYFEKQIASLREHARWEYNLTPDNLSKGITAQEYFDRVETNTMRALIGSELDEKTKNALVGINTLLFGFLGFAEFGFNPVGAQVAFLASLQDIGAQLPMMLEAFMKGESTDMIRVIGAIATLVWGPKALGKVEQMLATKVGKARMAKESARARKLYRKYMEQKLFHENKGKARLPVTKESKIKPITLIEEVIDAKGNVRKRIRKAKAVLIYNE